jgi:hypothetical protein
LIDKDVEVHKVLLNKYLFVKGFSFGLVNDEFRQMSSNSPVVRKMSQTLYGKRKALTMELQDQAPLLQSLTPTSTTINNAVINSRQRAE